MRRRESRGEIFISGCRVENETIYGGSKTCRRQGSRGCLYPGERYGEPPAGLSRCAPEEIEKESAGAAPDSENERHEAP